MTTLLDLYLHYAPPGTEPLTEEQLKTELRKRTERQRGVVKLVLRGMSYADAGVDLGITGGAVRGTLIETVRAIRKSALGLPRYDLTGREPGRGYGPKPGGRKRT